MQEKRNVFSWLRSLSRSKTETRATRIGVSNDASYMPPVSDYGVYVDNDSALKNTGFYAGIRIIAENFASLPKSVKYRSERGKIKAPQHRVNELLHRPNSYTNCFVFWSSMALWVKSWGNAYAWIERDSSGRPVALHQVSPDYVKVTISNGRKWFKIYDPDSQIKGLNGLHPDEDMLHVLELSTNGIKGLNPVSCNAAALEKAAAQEKFGAEFFRKGGNIRAVMETDDNLGDEKYERFVKHFQKASSNVETPLLEYGIKYKQLSVNPVDSQLLQSETMSIQDDCRILGLPPHMVAELSHATFSNIENQTIQFVQYTLRPLVKRFEAELEAKLLFDDERPLYSIEFNLDGLLRGDTAARSAYYHNAILDGYLSRNEVRALEGYEWKEGLDDMLYPVNEAVVGQEKEDNNNDEA